MKEFDPINDKTIWSKRWIAGVVLNLIFFNLTTALFLFYVKNSLFFSFMFGSMIYTYQAWILYLGASLFAIAFSFLLQKISRIKKRIWVLFIILLLMTFLFGFIFQQLLLMYFGFFVQTNLLANSLISLTFNKSIAFFTAPVWFILTLIHLFIFRTSKN